MGYDKDTMTGHGFRAMARTILDEVLQVRPDFIEHQLAHAVRDPNGRAYNRTAHLAERRKMMQTVGGLSGWTESWGESIAHAEKGVTIFGDREATRQAGYPGRFPDSFTRSYNRRLRVKKKLTPEKVFSNGFDEAIEEDKKKRPEAYEDNPFAWGDYIAGRLELSQVKEKSASVIGAKGGRSQR